MRRKLQHIVLCAMMVLTCVPTMQAQEAENDTLYYAMLHEVYCYAPLRFKNKQQERFYWRTVRDVKKTLPYAKRIAREIEQAEDTLAQMDDKDKRRWWKKRERELFREYEKDFRNMTASQGRMLMLLLDRECDRTSYELIVTFKSKFTADFWQFIAKLFKNDLKEAYDAKDKDRIIERVVTLVEADQL